MPIPENSRPLLRQSTKEMIYEVLCDWIICEKLLPGEKINDMELAKHFGVSRTPVREALQLLEAQKLVRFIPGKATVVSEVDKDDIEKCYGPLSVIQALAAEQACSRLTSAQLDMLDSYVKDLVRANENNDSQAAIISDMAFHDMIMGVADNGYMAEFSRTMVLHIERIKYHYFHREIMRTASIEQHEEILQAFRARDAALAFERMRTHWLYVMERCLTEILCANG